MGNGNDFKKIFKIDGMINNKGQGKLLSFIQLTDSVTDQILGNVQAMFKDKVMS